MSAPASPANTAPAKAGAVFRRSFAFLRRTDAPAGADGARPPRPPRRPINTAAPADLRRAIPRPSDRTLLRTSGWAMVIFAGLALGFLLHLFAISDLAEHRTQGLLYSKFRTELAFGSAPIGQVDINGALLAQGTPVAVMAIPALGISDAVVVEGTSSRTLLDGPGHRRDTPLPGQAGISVVYGRQWAYGGPFRDLASLKLGDTITTTTGQGVANYRVRDIRRAGDTAPPLPAATSGRLTLVTASGSPFTSNQVLRVDADLIGKAYPTPQPVLLPASLSSAEKPLGSDPSGWLPMVLFIELALVVGLLIVLALRRWGRWHTWIVGVPIVLVLGIEIAKQAVVVMPNLY